MEQKFNLKDVKVLRTKEGTIFEVVTIGVLIASIYDTRLVYNATSHISATFCSL